MGDARIADLPQALQMVRFRAGTGPRFLLTVDTEEEFDWSQPFARNRYRLDSLPTLRKFQQFCEGFAVAPLYLVDYPVADSPLAAEILGPALAAGKAEIGIQLHPWVNPPFTENVNDYNSFSGNLPIGLEIAKLSRLRERIVERLGAEPLVYRAGRYGAGTNTASILREAGVAIDSSVRARFDYSDAGGPDYRAMPIRPWWVGPPGSLMEVPLTTLYCGALRRAGATLYPALSRAPRLRGLFARTRLLERIPLTPEGVTGREAVRAIAAALTERLPLLVFSFHSPSLCPGHTPYVRSNADLDAFYDWWRTVFAVLKARGVRPTSAKELMASVELA
ncbi:MAG: polysaccharide deacetylase family protein [Sphingomonadales bacterium]|nr:polysaccharide deacetylase family protein [Sphingomonadales bacterium]